MKWILIIVGIVVGLVALVAAIGATIYVAKDGAAHGGAQRREITGDDGGAVPSRLR